MDELGVGRTGLAEIRRVLSLRGAQSLDVPSGEGEEGAPMVDFIPDESSGSDPEGAAQNVSVARLVSEILESPLAHPFWTKPGKRGGSVGACLNENERSILRMRYGLDGGSDGRTLEEISAVMGVTRERVRQIETKALKKLAARLRHSGIFRTDVL